MFERAAIFSAFLVFIVFFVGFNKFYQFMGLQPESSLEVVKEIFSVID